MAPTSAELLKRNEAYASTYKPAPYIAEIQVSGAEPPKTCVITCVDPRVFPERLLGLNLDCGATLFKDDWLRTEIGKASPEARKEIEGKELATIHGSIEQCLRDDMDWLKKQPLLRQGLRGAIKGFMFDIKSGKLQEVE